MHFFNAKHGQLNLHLPQELVVDNFAGGGGASTGLEMALGRPVAIAWFSPDCKHFSKAKGGNSVCPPLAAALVKANIQPALKQVAAA